MFRQYITVIFTWFLTLVSTSLYAEISPFIGVQSTEIETTLTYADGSEDYEFSVARLQLGFEFVEGGVAGIELITGDKDDIIDPFGTPFELEIKPAFGVFVNMGHPIYFRIGWSMWEAEYTNLNTDVTIEEDVSTLDYGIGILLPLGSNINIYADYLVRDSSANYETHITGNGNVDYDSELVSLGINVNF